MVNEYVYCPRLAFLEWVDSEWADSGDTEEGRGFVAAASLKQLIGDVETDDDLVFGGFVPRPHRSRNEIADLVKKTQQLFRGSVAAASLKFENLIEVELLQAMSSGALLQN